VADSVVIDSVAADDRLRLSRSDIDELVADRSGFVGAASAQVTAVVDRVAAVVALHPELAGYRPEPIL